MNRIERIEMLENIMNRHEELLASARDALEKLFAHQKEYLRLYRYYGSFNYRQDLVAYDDHRLPEDLRCGVLSEDEAYNVIGDHHQLAFDMLKMATAMLEQE